MYNRTLEFSALKSQNTSSAGVLIYAEPPVSPTRLGLK